MVALLASALVASVRAGFEDQEVYAPQPYQFGYETQDEYGNRQSRHEQDAGNGVKTGMYGFRDAYGLFRQVQYVADHRGFRAWVKTNEPGTQDSAPASARIESQQPHAAQIASAAAAAAPHHYRLVAPKPQLVHRLAPVAATPALVATPLRKVPVHHSLYPIGEISARHGPIQHAFSQQVPVLRKPSFRRQAARAAAVVPVLRQPAGPAAVVPVLHQAAGPAAVVPVVRQTARPAAVVPVVTPVAAAQGSAPVSTDYGAARVSGGSGGLTARSASGASSGGSRSGGSAGGSAGGSGAAAAAGGSARAVKKVRRRKPAEFFKKSIINKPRPKTSGPRVRVVQVTKNGGVRTVDVPVYRD